MHMYVYIYICVCVEQRSRAGEQQQRHVIYCTTCLSLSIYIYVYIHICISTCIMNHATSTGHNRVKPFLEFNTPSLLLACLSCDVFAATRAMFVMDCLLGV